MHLGNLRYLSLSPLYNAIFFPAVPCTAGFSRRAYCVHVSSQHNAQRKTWPTGKLSMSIFKHVGHLLPASVIIIYDLFLDQTSIPESMIKLCKAILPCHGHHRPARVLGPESTVAPVDFKTDPAGRFRSMAP